MPLRTCILIIGVCVMAQDTAIYAQSATGKFTPEATKLALDALKDVHNRGADLYNDGDPVGCLRMYQAALITVRPFLVHLPAVQKLIDTGLAEAQSYEPGPTPLEKAQTAKRQAFRLHELIEQVRAELKLAIAKNDATTTPSR